MTRVKNDKHALEFFDQIATVFEGEYLDDLYYAVEEVMRGDFKGLHVGNLTAGYEFQTYYRAIDKRDELTGIPMQIFGIKSLLAGDIDVYYDRVEITVEEYCAWADDQNYWTYVVNRGEDGLWEDVVYVYKDSVDGGTSCVVRGLLDHLLVGNSETHYSTREALVASVIDYTIFSMQD